MMKLSHQESPWQNVVVFLRVVTVVSCVVVTANAGGFVVVFLRVVTVVSVVVQPMQVGVLLPADSSPPHKKETRISIKSTPTDGNRTAEISKLPFEAGFRGVPHPDSEVAAGGGGKGS